MEGVSRLVRACNLSAFRLSAGRGAPGRRNLGLGSAEAINVACERLSRLAG